MEWEHLPIELCSLVLSYISLEIYFYTVSKRWINTLTVNDEKELLKRWVGPDHYHFRFRFGNIEDLRHEISSSKSRSHFERRVIKILWGMNKIPSFSLYRDVCYYCRFCCGWMNGLGEFLGNVGDGGVYDEPLSHVYLLTDSTKGYVVVPFEGYKHLLDGVDKRATTPVRLLLPKVGVNNIVPITLLSDPYKNQIYSYDPSFKIIYGSPFKALLYRGKHPKRAIKKRNDAVVVLERIIQYLFTLSSASCSESSPSLGPTSPHPL